MLCVPKRVANREAMNAESSSTPSEAPGIEPMPSRPRWRRYAAAGVAILLIGGAVGWAASEVLVPPRDILDSDQTSYVEVVAGEVGSSISLNTAAQWAPVPAGSNQSPGVVTAVSVSPGQEVGPGAVLYTVNLRPTVIAQGEVPAFRSMSNGTAGTDVAQLQSLLTTVGVFSGQTDGRFGPATARAVRHWQRSLGMTPDGVVQVGDIVFVPTLPTRVSLDTEILRRGSSVTGGEEVISVLPAAPTFTIPVTDTQAALMPLGTRVEIDAPGGGLWEAFVAGEIPASEETSRAIVLEGHGGEIICGSDCAAIPAGDRSLLRSRIVTEESVSGLVVPAAALRTSPDGSASVIDDAGEEHDVTIIAMADGMVVVTGIDLGARVRIPGEVR